MEDESRFNLNDLAVAALRESAKWCMFLAIVGFIGIGLMVIAGAFMSILMSSVDPYGGGMGGMNPLAGMGGVIGLVYIGMAVLYFFPVYYLFNYAKGIKQAFESGNNDLLTNALVNLKSHHKFLGILTIIVIALYILMFLGIAVFAASFGGGMH